MPEKTSMDFEQRVNGDRDAWPDGIDAIDHGVDVGENRGDIGGGFLELAGDLGMEESSRSNLQALNT
ncbi:MAG: hypothetical protein ACRDOI_37175 [Trebonia sp.]